MFSRHTVRDCVLVSYCTYVVAPIPLSTSYLFVCVWAVNSQAQLPPGHRSGGFCSADDLLMWIPVRQKGKCLCL